MSSSEPKAAKRQPQKRGPTGYGLFSKEQLPIVKSQHPDWTFAEISKHVSTRWKGASETEKTQWQEKAASMRATINAETPPPAADDVGGSKKRKRKNENSSSEPKPKRPLSAYMYFSNKNRAQIKEDNPKASFAELAGLVSSAWKELDDHGKEPYQSMANKDKKRYEAEKLAAK